jgi:hypothetical protein
MAKSFGWDVLMKHVWLKPIRHKKEALGGMVVAYIISETSVVTRKIEKAIGISQSDLASHQTHWPPSRMHDQSWG